MPRGPKSWKRSADVIGNAVDASLPKPRKRGSYQKREG